MIVPIFMPSRSAPYVPPSCPHCGKPLPGWGAPSGRFPWGEALIVLSIVAVFILSLITLAGWMMGDLEGHKHTLVEVIRGEWRWFVDLLHRIY